MRQAEKNLVKNTFFLYVMQISGYVFPLLTFPYLTRVLGAEKYGVVVFSNSIMAYFTLFIDFGFLLSGTNACSLAADDKLALGEITAGIILAKCLLLLLAAFVLVACCVLVSQIKENRLFFLLSFIGIALAVFIPDYLFRGIEKMDVLTYRMLASKAVYTALIFFCIHSDGDYLLVPIATIGSNAVAVLFTWVEIVRKKLIAVRLPSCKKVFAYLRDSSLFFLSRVASTFYSTLNTVLLGFSYPRAALGQYGVANTLSSTCRSLMSPIADSVYPYMVKQKNMGVIKKIMLVEPLVIAGCVFLWFAASPVILLVCGEGYENAVPILRAMLPLVALTLPGYIFGFPVLGALGKIQWANISVIVGAVFHVCMLFVLYAAGRLNFISLPILTFWTECIVFGIRFFVTVRTLRGTKHEAERG